MPPLAREQQVAKLRRGELDFIVTTDVIGHGINLPLSSVVFAETDKYDGITRRPLMLWEAAQIAGRAGRGSAPGFVACLRPFMGLSADASLVSRAIAVAAGGAAVAASCAAAVPTKEQSPAAPHMPSPAHLFCPTSSAPAGTGWGRCVPELRSSSSIQEMERMELELAISSRAHLFSGSRASKRFASASPVSYSDLPEKRALKIASAAELVSDLKLDFAIMRPSLQDLVRLGASSPFLLPLAMQRWERVFIEKNRDWIRSGDLRAIVQRIDCVTSAMLGRASHGYNFEYPSLCFSFSFSL